MIDLIGKLSTIQNPKLTYVHYHDSEGSSYYTACQGNKITESHKLYVCVCVKLNLFVKQPKILEKNSISI